MLIPVHRPTLPAALVSTSWTPPTSPERTPFSGASARPTGFHHQTVRWPVPTEPPDKGETQSHLTQLP